MSSTFSGHPTSAKTGFQPPPSLSFSTERWYVCRNGRGGRGREVAISLTRRHTHRVGRTTPRVHGALTRTRDTSARGTGWRDRRHGRVETATRDEGLTEGDEKMGTLPMGLREGYGQSQASHLILVALSEPWSHHYPSRGRVSTLVTIEMFRCQRRRPRPDFSNIQSP